MKFEKTENPEPIIHPIHRNLLIAMSLGFVGAMGLLSMVVLVFG